METEDAWSSIEADVENILRSMETYRRSVYKKGFRFGILIGGIVAVIVLCAIEFSASASIVLGVLTMLIVLSLSLAIAFVRLDNRYKKEIMPILTDAVCPNATYDAKTGVDIDQKSVV